MKPPSLSKVEWFPLYWGFVVASKSGPDLLVEIEENQKQLRENIEKSMELAEKSQELLDRHRDELKNKH